MIAWFSFGFAPTLGLGNMNMVSRLGKRKEKTIPFIENRRNCFLFFFTKTRPYHIS